MTSEPVKVRVGSISAAYQAHRILPASIAPGSGTVNLSTKPNTTLAELQDVQLPGILRNEGNGAAARAISGQG